MLNGGLGSVPAVWTSFIKHFTFIRYAIPIRVTIRNHIHGIGLPNRNPVIEGKNNSGKVEVVDEDGGFVHPSVSVEIDQSFDSSIAEGFGSGSIFVLHITSHLSDIHRTISVPHCEYGFLNLWLRCHELSNIARR